MKPLFSSEWFRVIAKLAISLTVLLLVVNSYLVKRQMNRIVDNQLAIVKAMDVLAEGMVKKAVWDKQVAEKIRELDEYTKTNQVIQGTVR